MKLSVTAYCGIRLMGMMPNVADYYFHRHGINVVYTMDDAFRDKDSQETD